MAWTPGDGPQALRYEVLHTTLTANASANTKATSYTQLVASTAADYYGIVVELCDMANAATVTSGLVDLAVGASSSEQIIVPDLNAGYSASGTSSAQTPGQLYYFPLHVPSATRLSARMAASTGSDTCQIRVWGLTTPRSLPTFECQRVTAYGVVASSSRGTNVTPSATANTYGTATSLDNNTANPIRFLQVGIAGGGSTALGGRAAQFKIQLGSQLLIDKLRFANNASELVLPWDANFLLAQCEWDIPSGSDLQIAMMANGASEPAHDFILYGMG